MKYDRRAYKLNEGFAWNPLLKYPRNSECFCGSMEKFKKCCLPLVKPVVLAKDEAKILAYMRQGKKIKLVDGTDKDANGVK